MKKIVLACLLVVWFSGLQAQTPVIYVKTTATSSGTGTSWDDACDLETAMSKASPGTQIWVEKGEYKPTKTLVVPDSVALYGGFSGNEIELLQRNYATYPTIINAQKNYGPVVRLNVSAVLDGFIVKNGMTTHPLNKDGGGVWMDGYSKLENCFISDNTAAGKGGGVYSKGASVSIANTTFKDNLARGCDSNIYGACIVVDPKIPYYISPVLKTHPSPAVLHALKGVDVFPTLSVSLLEGTNETYRWYSNEIKSNKGGSLISGATGTSYTPPTDNTGPLYYYCVVSNSCDTAVSTVSGAHIVYTTTDCNSGNFDPGVVSFKSPTIWTITNENTKQIWEWSDAVTATNCQKTTFAGGSSGNFNADCRSNSDNSADFFSWCAVTRFAAQLCPAPWRVPTQNDFVNLDIALGGDGNNRTMPITINQVAWYTNDWGGTAKSYCDQTGIKPLLSTYYWALSESGGNEEGHSLYFAYPTPIRPRSSNMKNLGLALRCVRDK